MSHRSQEYGVPQFADVKLVVWDLDDTFWSGTVSEGGITAIQANIDLVRRLTDCGVINSICSKNDRDVVNAELHRLGVGELFVMNSISWEPKGQRIRELIDDMQLQARHVLFIDDNRLNLQEAIFYCPDIMVAAPDVIPDLIRHATTATPSDLQHKRLERYRILEEKVHEKSIAASNEAFLRESGICVSFISDCLGELDRIAELTTRTNQLNFTKKRMSRDQLAALLSDPDTTASYVQVRDRFGDYGIVGYYALRDGEVIHFVFSCSIMGMGIEQFTYDYLGRPALTVIGEVASSLDPESPIDYISVATDSHAANNRRLSQGPPRGRRERRVLFKGPCDIMALVPLMNARSAAFDAEVNYPDDRGVMITAMNHTAHIVQALTRSHAEIEGLLHEAPFLNPDAFKTNMFDGYDAVVLSMLPDSHEGFYVLRDNPQLGIAFSSFNFNLTDPNHWDSFIDGTYVNHGYPFTRHVLARFADHFDFIGPLPIASVVQNLEQIRSRLDDSTLLVLLLGSEVAPTQVTAEFRNHANRHYEINRAVEEFAIGRPAVRLVNFTNHISGDADFVADINHLTRRKYLEVAGQISDVLNDYFEEELSNPVTPYRWLVNQVVGKIRSRLRERKSKIQRLASSR